jgi:hypothetical protein
VLYGSLGAPLLIGKELALLIDSSCFTKNCPALTFELLDKL